MMVEGTWSAGQALSVVPRSISVVDGEAHDPGAKQAGGAGILSHTKDGRLDGGGSIVAPDFINREANDDPDRPDRGLRGPAGLIATGRWLTETFSDLRFEPHDVIAEGETVVVMATVTGTHSGAVRGTPPTHKPFQQRQFHLYRMRAGQIVEHLALRDDLGLLRQLGVLLP